MGSQHWLLSTLALGFPSLHYHQKLSESLQSEQAVHIAAIGL